MLFITIQCLLLASNLSAIPMQSIPEVLLELSERSLTHRVPPHQSPPHRLAVAPSARQNHEVVARAHPREIVPTPPVIQRIVPAPLSDHSSELSSASENNNFRRIVGGTVAVIALGGIAGGSYAAFQKVKVTQPTFTTVIPAATPTPTK